MLNCLIDGVFISPKLTVWIGATVIAATLACMTAAWMLGQNLVILTIRRAETEETKDVLRPLRRTIGPEASGRAVIYGALAGLVGSIAGPWLGPFLKCVVLFDRQLYGRVRRM
jgi:hypothetical protein